MTYRITTPVATEPVTIAEARLQVKVDDDDTSQDALIETYITAAREYAEHYTGRALAVQTLEQALDEFPGSDESIELEMPPVNSVTSIKYTDEAGAEQTLAPASYALKTRSTTPREIALTYGNTWPATRAEAEAVRIITVCGDTPEAAKSAILIDIEIRYNKLTPAEADNYRRARDSLLDTIKVYGF